ncbi:hypothetical protein HDU87_000100 [Geranomyces variabilis]|uniref:HTH La-type RNA-binding domain-containing protein n=1 Tax=Geranomyces variabilis TaxID=109894 RepID=A0AAD5TS17_9FUNG|nr:hypothetical protein HDU87_000100 [Geranomyces variabilis]
MTTEAAPPTASLATVPDAEKQAVAAPVAPTCSSEELRQKVLDQVEYYFSDDNLPFDSFMLKTVAQDPKGDGWVGINVLLRFNKLRALTTDPLVVAESLRNSVELLEVSEDGHKGSVFVKFGSNADATAALAAKEFEGHAIESMPKDTYVASKLKEYGTYVPNKDYELKLLEVAPQQTRPPKSLLFFDGASPLTLVEDVRKLFWQENILFVKYISSNPSGKVAFRHSFAAERIIKRLGGQDEHVDNGVPLEVTAANGLAGGSVKLRLPSEDETAEFWAANARKGAAGLRGGAGDTRGGRGGGFSDRGRGRGDSRDGGRRDNGRDNGRDNRGGRGGRGRGNHFDTRIRTGQNAGGGESAESSPAPTPQDRLGARPPTVGTAKRKADDALPHGDEKVTRLD